MKKAITNFVCIATAAIALITSLVYITSKAQGHVIAIMLFLILGALLEILLLFNPGWKFVEYIPFLSLLVAGLLFTKSGADELYAIFSKMNMEGLSTSWIVSAVLIVVTLILAGATTVIYPYRNK
ncbi:MAG: hypothetical protein M3036_03875 [Bifidobacteriales bacterium]|nr:hypothetical protein [Bifidobacteriales bacterium]